MTKRPLLFDMDGLLLDTERVALAAFVQCAADLGHSDSAATDIFLTLVGGSSTQTHNTLVQEFGAEATATLEQSWAKRYVSLLSDTVPLKPTVRSTISALAELGHPMAVVTSTKGAHARDHLSHAGLLPLFQHVIGGDAVTANKPDPAPYLAGAAALSVASSTCTAFEDSDRGVTAAIAAGCSTWQIPDLRPPHQPYPELGQSFAPTLRAAAEGAGLL